MKFTYNPEWFEDEDEDEEEEWDLQKYRKETQDERDAAEEARIYALQGGYREPPAEYNDSSDEDDADSDDKGGDT